MRCEKARARDTSRDTHGRFKGDKLDPKGATSDIDNAPTVVILEPIPRLRIRSLDLKPKGYRTGRTVRLSTGSARKITSIFVLFLELIMKLHYIMGLAK